MQDVQILSHIFRTLWPKKKTEATEKILINVALNIDKYKQIFRVRLKAKNVHK